MFFWNFRQPKKGIYKTTWSCDASEKFKNSQIIGTKTEVSPGLRDSSAEPCRLPSLTCYYLELQINQNPNLVC